MKKEKGILIPIGIFLLIFLSLFLIREINITGSFGHCIPSYICYEWAACNNSLQTRECVDSNSCSQQPVKTEYRTCSSENSSNMQNEAPSQITPNQSSIMLTVITSVLVIFIAFFIIAIFTSKKISKMESSLKVNPEIKSYIKQALDRGHGIDQIKEDLEKAGWPKDMIEQSIKEN